MPDLEIGGVAQNLPKKVAKGPEMAQDIVCCKEKI
jgi:hypothetical protein